jgi:diketogulonate reductase-like aldo/keto reductase
MSEALTLRSTRRLANGVEMPIYGLGLSHNGGFSVDAVNLSLDLGVNLLDTATRYGNESQVGDILRARAASGASPAGIFGDSASRTPFLTSKLWPGDAGDVAGACRTSCAKLGVDSLDLYLVHWPGIWGHGGNNREYRQQVWRQMELLLDSGACRAIGVSNFEQRHLEDVIEECAVVPHVNQIEFNPYQNPASLTAFCRGHGIVVEGYCPLAKGNVLQEPAVLSIARKHGQHAATVLLRWSLQQGVVCIPKSTSAAHIRDNLKVFDIALDDEDMRALGSLHCDLRVTWDPTDVA